MKIEELDLGDRLRDLVTGFVGVAVARTEWLNGCWRIQLQRLGKDDKIEHEAFDIQQLTVVEKHAVKVSRLVDADAPGGDRTEAQQRPDPPRHGVCA